MAIVSTVIGAPVSEELLFRGFLLGGLIRFGVGVWLAILISNGLWTGMHAGYSALGLIEVFVAGLFLSAAFLVSRSIWPPIVLHVLFNVAALVVMVAVVGA
ncbi:MAG: CPBP family intramembrane glutamic endopeptidase [Pseudomonadota bacterium]